MSFRSDIVDAMAYSLASMKADTKQLRKSIIEAPVFIDYTNIMPVKAPKPFATTAKPRSETISVHELFRRGESFILNDKLLIPTGADMRIAFGLEPATTTTINAEAVHLDPADRGKYPELFAPIRDMQSEIKAHVLPCYSMGSTTVSFETGMIWESVRIDIWDQMVTLVNNMVERSFEFVAYGRAECPVCASKTNLPASLAMAMDEAASILGCPECGRSLNRD